MKKIIFWLPLVLITVSLPVSAVEFKHQQKGVECVKCHKTESPVAPPKSRICFECHTYDAVRPLTANMPLNPHDAHVGEVRCNLCHHEHSASEVYCKECHKSGDEKFNFNVP